MAYVSEAERKRLFDLPSGQFKPAVKSLEKEIKAAFERAKEEEKLRIARAKAGFK